MLKIVLIVALVAFAPSEAHLKTLLLKKAIAKHFLPSALAGTLPPVKNVLPFLGGVLGGGAGGGAVASETVVDGITDVYVDSSENASSENTERDVADPPQSSEVPVMPTVPAECTADKPCSPPHYFVPVYVLYPYYYPYPYYSYYPYYPYPYPHFYASSELRSESPAPAENSW